MADKEYIEREAVVENLREFQKAEQRLYNWATSDAEKNKRRSWIGAISVCISEARNAPTADVVEVVRCKDCMFSETIKSIIDGGTMRVCHYGVYRQSAPDMHYCSHGHKKMDGKGEG